MSEVYDTIGTSYTVTRRADPRIERAIWTELNGCRSVLDNGAGTGAYEPFSLTVVAVELRELRRVARGRLVILHWDQDVLDQSWLAEYVPEGFAFDRRRAPSLEQVIAVLDLETEVVPLMIPHDCLDGFAVAYWRRPEAYLDPTRRAGMSMFAQTEHLCGDGLQRLERDLDNGAWRARHHALLNLSEHDCGYRLVIGSIDRPGEQ
jgi:hypothetical protein